MFYNFFLQNFSKIFSKTYHFLKFSRGCMSPNPLSKCVALPRRAMQMPSLFQKYFEPPRNKILDTPLNNKHTCAVVFTVINRVERARSIAIVTHKYMLMCNYKIRCLRNSTVRSEIGQYTK